MKILITFFCNLKIIVEIDKAANIIQVFQGENLCTIYPPERDADYAPAADYHKQPHKVKFVVVVVVVVVAGVGNGNQENKKNELK